MQKSPEEIVIDEVMLNLKAAMDGYFISIYKTRIVTKIFGKSQPGTMTRLIDHIIVDSHYCRLGDIYILGPDIVVECFSNCSGDFHIMQESDCRYKFSLSDPQFINKVCEIIKYHA